MLYPRSQSQCKAKLRFKATMPMGLLPRLFPPPHTRFPCILFYSLLNLHFAQSIELHILSHAQNRATTWKTTKKSADGKLGQQM